MKITTFSAVLALTLGFSLSAQAAVGFSGAKAAAVQSPLIHVSDDGNDGHDSDDGSEGSEGNEGHDSDDGKTGTSSGTSTGTSTGTTAGTKGPGGRGPGGRGGRRG